MLGTNMEGNDQEEGPEPDGQTELERIQKYKKTGIGRMEKAGDLSVKVDPYFWKRLKKVDEK